MERTVAALTRHYPRRDEAAQQAVSVLNHYHTLVNPEQSDFTYDDGRVELLLSLTGVLPVPIGANTYHCPVAIWLPLDFPSRPPIVYVLASETLQIRKGKHVDANGKVEAPYLENWERKSEGCSLMSLINELIPIFSARYPLSPVQAKPKAQPQPSSSGVSAAPARPPLPNAQPQAVPPRPAPPPSVSPSGSHASATGPPPRPPLPAHSATMGPQPPSRPLSMSFEPPTRSMTTAPDGRSGSPAAPPRPPPPRADLNGTGPSPMGRPLPGSLAPPPAYPAQPPLAPPIPPPQQMGPTPAMSPSPASYSQPPPPPAYPAGIPPPGHAAYSAQNRSSPRPTSVAGADLSYGEATPAPSWSHGASHHAQEQERSGSPSQSTVRSLSPQHTSQARHPREQDALHRSSAYHERQTSFGSAQGSHRANGNAADPRFPEPRAHSPAPSVAASTMSYTSAGADPSHHAYRPHAYGDEYRGPPTSPPQPHPVAGPATSHHPPPGAHLASPRPPQLMYDRAQTHSPAPLSEAGSYASSQMRQPIVGRSPGPRPPGPPSEYSTASGHVPYGQQSSVLEAGNPSHGYPASPPHSPPGRAPPNRSMTVSYEARDPTRSYDERETDPAFEPRIESRTAPLPPAEPIASQAPPSRQSSTHSDYTVTTSAFIPQQQQQYEPSRDAAQASIRGAALSPPAPSSNAASISNSHTPAASGTSYYDPSVNGFAPPIPVVAPLPPAQRAIRKTRPASTTAKPVNILDAADDDLESSAPSSPSTVTDPRASRTVVGADSVSQAGAAAPASSVRAPPVPPNPALLALRTRVHSKLSGAMAQLAHSTQAELVRLDLMRIDLEKAQPAIEDEMARLEAVRSVCGGVRDRYAQVVAEAQQRMREYEARGEGVDVDEIICGSTVVYTQLLDLVAEDAALEDTIYALGRGLNSDGVANIDLDQFLKRVRLLAKEQFVIRATINKILNGLALRRQGRESQQAIGRGGTPVLGGAGGDGSGRGTPTSVA